MRRHRNFPVIFFLFLIIVQAFSWFVFFTERVRAPYSLDQWIAIGAGIALAIVMVMLWEPSMSQLVVVIVNTFLLIIVIFATFYWSYGSNTNFNVPLTRLDALYFSIGTMATGTRQYLCYKRNVARYSNSADGIGFRFYIVCCRNSYSADDFRVGQREDYEWQPLIVEDRL